jgi:SAM-dependent methyltransferase
MSKINSAPRPHSADYFGEERDYLWNQDYLDLLASRLALSSITSIADIGCGVGHWSALLYPRLSPDTELIGVDADRDNLAGFRRRFSERPGARVRALQADAGALPLRDEAFDATTCQTLLIHLEDPIQAVREMIRITRPGGLVMCAEPNNLFGRFPSAWSAEHMSLERLTRLTEMAWRYTRGRRLRGLGRDHFGELLPGLFAELGLENIRVWLCDKTALMIPPYESPAQQAFVRSYERWRASGTGPFDREDMRANVLADGGTDAFFDAAWADYLADDRATVEAMGDARWSSAGGTLLYLVVGERR